MLASAVTDSLRRLRALIETTFCPLAFAHRARCAATIRARPAADRVLPVRNDTSPFKGTSFTSQAAKLQRFATSIRWRLTQRDLYKQILKNRDGCRPSWASSL